jgi:signal transduction histidine kinase
VEQLISELVARVQPLWEKVGIEVDSTLGESSEPKIDERSFERVLGNLITNAARHAEARVLVRLAHEDDWLVAAVHDDGPGIPAQDRKCIFEPFVRLDKSRSRETGGVGLGLAIVSRVLRANSGEVRVEESDLGGAAFLTSWPSG